MKFKTIILMFLIAVLALAGFVSAVSDNYDIQSVEANGIDVTSDKIVYVERGEDVDLKVILEGTGNVDDVTVKAWIGGYEYGDVKDKTEIFEVIDGVTYAKKLKLSIPDDIDASENYTLHVQAYDKNDEEEIAFNLKLRVEEVRHKLSIQDVIVRPSESIDAGRPLFVTVRVENLGAKKEDDIKVTVSIPALGVSQRDYIDELAAVETEDEETSESSGEIYLRIPDDAKTGDYELKVEVEYNRGHNIVTETQTIHVEGITRLAENTVLSLDTTSQDIAQGGEAVYKVMLANLGDKKQVYSVELSGIQLWATGKVEPASVTVESERTGELYVKLTAKKDATGKQTAVLRVLSGTDLIKEVLLEANVNGSSGVSAKKVLGIVAGVLVIILIILALVVAFKRMGGSEEETTAEEGKSYY